MNEYELLRAEILNEFDAVAQYNGILYTASAAMLAFGIERESFLLCLLPYFVIIPIHFMREDKFNMMCKIGAYMHVFLEGTDYQWERRKQALDSDNVNQKAEVTAWRIHLQYYFTLVICSLLSIGIVIQKEYSNFSKIFLVSAILIITIAGIIIVNKSTINFTRVRASYIRRWEHLKEKEVARQDRARQ